MDHPALFWFVSIVTSILAIVFLNAIVMSLRDWNRDRLASRTRSFDPPHRIGRPWWSKVPIGRQMFAVGWKMGANAGAHECQQLYEQEMIKGYMKVNGEWRRLEPALFNHLYGHNAYLHVKREQAAKAIREGNVRVRPETMPTFIEEDLNKA